MLLVASETGHVYTFATPKLQPMITSEAGKALIQTCLHQPDPAPMNQGPHQGDFDVRMSSTGYEETDLGYTGLGEEETFKVGLSFYASRASNRREDSFLLLQKEARLKSRVAPGLKQFWLAARSGAPYCVHCHAG